jgi:hypothetical protein
MTELWLDEHGPDAEPPPELLAEIRRLRGDAEQNDTASKSEDDR